MPQSLRDALRQAIDRLKSGYTPSPLDGDKALLDKLEAAYQRGEREEQVRANVVTRLLALKDACKLPECEVCTELQKAIDLAQSG